MRLLSKIVIKDFSENECFVLDLEDESDLYLKCVDVFAELMKHIYKLESFSQESLVSYLKTQYPDVDQSQLNQDVISFIQFLREKKFLAE